MKVIISHAGGGKSFKVAELSKEYNEKNKRVIIFSEELGLREYRARLLEKGADLGLVQVRRTSFSSGIRSIVSMLLTQTLPDVIFFDCFIRLKEKDIELLKVVEKYTGKEVYVTMQVNRDVEFPDGVRVLVDSWSKIKEVLK